MNVGQLLLRSTSPLGGTPLDSVKLYTQQGDSWAELAARTGVLEQTLKQANPQLDPQARAFGRGEALNVPVREPEAMACGRKEAILQDSPRPASRPPEMRESRTLQEQRQQRLAGERMAMGLAAPVLGGLGTVGAAAAAPVVAGVAARGAVSLGEMAAAKQATVAVVSAESVGGAGGVGCLIGTGVHIGTASTEATPASIGVACAAGAVAGATKLGLNAAAKLPNQLVPTTIGNAVTQGAGAGAGFGTFGWANGVPGAFNGQTPTHSGQSAATTPIVDQLPNKQP